MENERPLYVDIIPYPVIQAGFVLVLRYRGGRTVRIEHSHGRYRLKRWISSFWVAEMAGVSEDFLFGIEQALKAAARWDELTMEQRRNWVNP